MKRRDFLKTVGGVAGAAAFGVNELFGADEPLERVEGLPRRALGKTGQKLSVVGFPGLALVHYDQEKCTAAIHSAFERGLNYYDVAPAYGNGQCETKMGIGLQGLDRSKYFLACKTKKRDKEGCRKELEQSLRLLKTDYFDLYQLHHLVRPSEVQQALGPDGAMEAILEARKAGKVRFIGYSAHTTKAALEVMKGFKFDTVMFPINFVEYYNRGFGKDVLALAREQGCGVLAIKPLSWGTWPAGMTKTRQWWYRSVEEPADVELAMRFALSQNPVVAGIPPSFLDLLDKTIEAAKAFKPLDAPAIEKLKEMAANAGSIFIREEQQVALNPLRWSPVYPESPHESGSGHLV
ncbi:MAG TPA: aldo/keto reductase [Verrucomicrobiota bacterium]|jgi:predicted aldo/keto reductase-like oxidoreductase|nr:aldo/keto reductase [Verrucomicrobiota bacterium]HRT07781.1 aldo/keto reductase [Candidatus Paceibacterota bacterium]HRT58734.1 aldo/keto reductase [Candidatus Paceibacterota bacterium]